MNSCPSCRRHLILQETSCPFCGSSLQSPLGRAAQRLGTGVAMMLAPIVLAACYGVGGKFNDSGVVDADGDGYDSLEDCDDTNPDIYPGAVEVCDDTIDNDCDTTIDADDTDCAT